MIVQAFPAVRAAVREMLKEEKDIVLLGECGDGEAAVLALRRHRPDLLFLGVQLPGRNGFDLLHALDGDSPPAVIFVSMFERYAAHAFNVHAVDYLLHPFTRYRFRQALVRARHRLDRHRRRGSGAGLLPRRDAAPTKKFLLRTEGRLVVLSSDEIEAVVAQRPYSVVHTRTAAYPARSSLEQFRRRLARDQFVRINRTTLVNTRRVSDVVPRTHGDGLVRLEGGHEFRLSRRFRSEWSVLLATASEEAMA